VNFSYIYDASELTRAFHNLPQPTDDLVDLHFVAVCRSVCD